MFLDRGPVNVFVGEGLQVPRRVPTQKSAQLALRWITARLMKFDGDKLQDPKLYNKLSRGFECLHQGQKRAGSCIHEYFHFPLIGLVRAKRNCLKEEIGIVAF